MGRDGGAGGGRFARVTRALPPPSPPRAEIAGPWGANARLFQAGAPGK